MKIRIAILLLIGALLLSVNLPSTGRAESAYERSDLEQDQSKARQLLETASVTEVLGPLAPVALSPFFGITCLSGTSILSNKGILPQNDFLQGNEVLNNGMVFTVFLLLTALTAVPKFTTPTKAVAELADQVETYAGVITYAAIIFLADFGQSASESQLVYQAGIFTFTHETLLVIAAAANIIVIHTVKFFFELLVLISPIPLLDAIFEATSKTIAAALAVLYAFRPRLAFVVNLILFLICLVIFKWAHKRIKYLKALVLDPLIVGMFGIKDPDRRARRLARGQFAEAEPICKAFPNKRIGKVKKKDLCYLFKTDAGFVLIKPRLFRAPVTQTVALSNATIGPGIVHHAIEFTDQMDRPRKLFFSRVYTNRIDQIKALVGDKTTPIEKGPNPAEGAAPGPQPA